MSNEVLITIRCNTVPVRFAIWLFGALLYIGVGPSVAMAIARPFAWTRIYMDGDKPWSGWTWLGNAMAVSDDD